MLSPSKKASTCPLVQSADMIHPKIFFTPLCNLFQVSLGPVLVDGPVTETGGFP
jgi:hypothetical protein